MPEDALTDNREPLVDASEARPSAACSSRCRRHAARQPLLAAAGWLAAAVGSLLVAAIPYEGGESVCGVWGCFPPLQAVAAMHLFWCVVLSAAVWSVREWLPRLCLPLGVVLFIGAATTTGVVLGNDLYRWLNSMPEEYRIYWPRRVAYTLATLTDVPLTQSLLAGLVCIGIGRPFRKRA
jgi:hypothetical protein